jgi:hypothetical protein
MSDDLCTEDKFDAQHKNGGHGDSTAGGSDACGTFPYLFDDNGITDGDDCKENYVYKDAGNCVTYVR